MTIRAYDIIAKVCSDFKEVGSNNLQVIYEITNTKEARLAYDILVTHGFDAKIYSSPQKTAKLYVTHPTTDLPGLEDALTYAEKLNNIRHELDDLPAQNYTLYFTNTPPAGKQILIQITSAASPSPAPRFAVSAAPQIMTSKPTAQPKGRRKAAPEEDSIATGPAVAKASYAKVLGEDGDRKDTLRKRIFLYFTGNMATSSFAFMVMVVGLGLLFSFFVFAKAFICPDFASMKRNHSWYCSMFVSDDEKDDKKQP